MNIISEQSDPHQILLNHCFSVFDHFVGLVPKVLTGVFVRLFRTIKLRFKNTCI